MRVCLIAEKHSLARDILPTVREMHPDLDPAAFACVFSNPFIHLNARFRYPRGLAWADYPFVSEAAYHPVRFGHVDPEGRPAFAPLLGIGADGRPERALPGMEDVHDEAAARLSRADVIYAAVDPGPSSWFALDRCLAELPPGGAPDVRIPLLRSLCRSELAESFAAPHRPGDALHARWVGHARLRRRFDYSYQVNALAVHGRAMRAAGADAGAMPPSKFGLQALYDLRRHGPLSAGAWLQRMQDWRGTGRYDGLCIATGHTLGLGSFASRHVIVDALSRAGLVEPHGPHALRISACGTRFLDMLHPDSEDVDLPFRLDAWASLAEEGRPRVDRYLRTFFGRQIRFAARQAS